MKHSAKVVMILLGMFFVTQLIGLAVVHYYGPEYQLVVDENGKFIEKTVYNLPYGMEPPEGVTPSSTLVSIVMAIGIAIPLAAIKIFKRNIIVHNVTELFIYPGIASIFVPLLNIWTVVLLLIIISVYDIYAVWHAGFMQKMAQYQIKELKFFTGFFVPYLGPKERAMIKEAKKRDKLKDKKVKVNVAILGGGDVIFPIILAGVVYNTLGLLSALIISVGATAALGWLFYISKKGKFYPAMPLISVGCFIALGIAYLV